MNRKIIIDCDPGHDDAIALLLAVRAGIFDILGVTTVAGNTGLENTYANARKILAFASRQDIPVFAGAEKPLARALHNDSGAFIHGRDGLGNFSVQAELGEEQEMDAADFLVQTLMRSECPLTLVCIGPLTNIAMAFEKEPQCIGKVERLFIMGGAVHAPGNVTKYAEFNFYIDPEAAKIVVESGASIHLFGLDVTMQALLYHDDIEQLARASSPVAALAGKLLRLYAGNYEKQLGFFACPVHDALCIAALMREGLVEYERVLIDIETQGEQAGRCAVGEGGHAVFSGTYVDRDVFAGLLKETLLQG